MNIQQAIRDARKEKSKLTGEDISKLHGLSSPCVWHLLNNLASQAKTYLEVGVFKGSTFLASNHKNNLEAYAVDNFSMNPASAQEFMVNTKHLDFTLFFQNAWEVRLENLKNPIELYFYDGDHSFEAQYKAIEYYLPAMADEFVYVCDDWNMKKIPNATFTAAKNLKLKVVENHDLFCVQKGQWWNGIGICRFKKP
jgi:predicted O-methyltransferase YrrM